MQHEATVGTVRKRQLRGALKQLVIFNHMSHETHSVAAPGLPTHHPLRLSEGNLLTLLMVDMLKKHQKEKKNQIIYTCTSQLPHKSIIDLPPQIMHSCQQLRRGQSISLELAAGPVALLRLPSQQTSSNHNRRITFSDLRSLPKAQPGADFQPYTLFYEGAAAVAWFLAPGGSFLPVPSNQLQQRGAPE